MSANLLQLDRDTLVCFLLARHCMFASPLWIFSSPPPPRATYWSSTHKIPSIPSRRMKRAHSIYFFPPACCALLLLLAPCAAVFRCAWQKKCETPVMGKDMFPIARFNRPFSRLEVPLSLLSVLDTLFYSPMVNDTVHCTVRMDGVFLCIEEI